MEASVPSTTETITPVSSSSSSSSSTSTDCYIEGQVYFRHLSFHFNTTTTASTPADLHQRRVDALVALCIHLAKNEGLALIHIQGMKQPSCTPTVETIRHQLLKALTTVAPGWTSSPPMYHHGDDMNSSPVALMTLWNESVLRCTSLTNLHSTKGYSNAILVHFTVTVPPYNRDNYHDISKSSGRSKIAYHPGGPFIDNRARIVSVNVYTSAPKALDKLLHHLRSLPNSEKLAFILAGDLNTDVDRPDLSRQILRSLQHWGHITATRSHPATEIEGRLTEDKTRSPTEGTTVPETKQTRDMVEEDGWLREKALLLDTDNHDNLLKGWRYPVHGEKENKSSGNITTTTLLLPFDWVVYTPRDWFSVPHTHTIVNPTIDITLSPEHHHHRHHLPLLSLVHLNFPPPLEETSPYKDTPLAEFVYLPPHPSPICITRFLR